MQYCFFFLYIYNTISIRSKEYFLFVRYLPPRHRVFIIIFFFLRRQVDTLRMVYNMISKVVLRSLRRRRRRLRSFWNNRNRVNTKHNNINNIHAVHNKIDFGQFLLFCFILCRTQMTSGCPPSSSALENTTITCISCACVQRVQCIIQYVSCRYNNVLFGDGLFFFFRSGYYCTGIGLHAT